MDLAVVIRAEVAEEEKKPAAQSELRQSVVACVIPDSVHTLFTLAEGDPSWRLLTCFTCWRFCATKTICIYNNDRITRILEKKNKKTKT